ncbi:uncharacterized protein LOC122859480 [Aphidius gifuensis]|uniref:uncharacterized protein LOC122859480 n=1 Tax=Aphidius gifuensis TaxID=684658 RepID=UPI001CDCD45D|nr:uncharacterized protein LOC122859480 [Aphidius gifuensis]
MSPRNRKHEAASKKKNRPRINNSLSMISYRTLQRRSNLNDDNKVDILLECVKSLERNATVDNAIDQVDENNLCHDLSADSLSGSFETLSDDFPILNDNDDVELEHSACYCENIMDEDMTDDDEENNFPVNNFDELYSGCILYWK